MMRVWREDARARGGAKEGDEWVKTLLEGWEWWSGRVVSSVLNYTEVNCAVERELTHSSSLVDQELLRSILLPLDRSFVLVKAETVNILYVPTLAHCLTDVS